VNAGESFPRKAMTMTMRMNFRMLSLSAIAWAVLVASAPALAANEAGGAHEGNVINVFGQTLVMRTMGGPEETHKLAADAKLTLDGKPCAAADLRAGTRIRVTAGGADKSEVTRIEGLDKNVEFASFRHDGKIVSIAGDRLVLKGIPGEDEQTCTLSADVKVTLDGKVCKAADLKSGMRVRVTAASDNPFAATWIEALDKNLEFANL
jgi:hypothetical protein